MNWFCAPWHVPGPDWPFICSPACPGCKGRSLSNVVPRQRGCGGGSPVQALPSPSCVKPFHITPTEGCLSAAGLGWAGSLLSVISLHQKLGKRGISPSCLASGVISSWLCLGRAVSHAFPGAHPCVCAHSLGWAFCRKILWGKMHGHMYLSGPIYSVVFYLIGLTPPLFLHVFPNARKALHFSLLYMFGICVSDVFGRLELLWVFWSFFPLQIKVLKVLMLVAWVV